MKKGKKSETVKMEVGINLDWPSHTLYVCEAQGYLCRKYKKDLIVKGRCDRCGHPKRCHIKKKK